MKANAAKTGAEARQSTSGSLGSSKAVRNILNKNNSNQKQEFTPRMKFEFQCENLAYRGVKNGPKKLLPRKYGPRDYIYKGTTGIRLETETGGVLEFETGWENQENLLAAIKEAVQITKHIDALEEDKNGFKMMPQKDLQKSLSGKESHTSPGLWSRTQYKYNDNERRTYNSYKTFENSQNESEIKKYKKYEKKDKEKQYERNKDSNGDYEEILAPDEHIYFKIIDKSWIAGIQSSEAIALTQFSSMLREHEPNMLNVVNAKVGKPMPGFERLRSFLQYIAYYIHRGQKGEDMKVGTPSKAAFLLMSRTSFSSMYRDLLTDKEQEAFRKLVQEGTILEVFGLTKTDVFFKYGYGTIAAKDGVTVDEFLQSIYNSKRKNKKDELSPPDEGSAAQGRFDVNTSPNKKDTNLIKIETRGTYRKFVNPNIKLLPSKKSIRAQPASNWVAYAQEISEYAATNRPRNMTGDPLPKKIGGTEADKNAFLDYIFDWFW